MLNLNRSLERKVGIDSGGCGRCMIGSGNVPMPYKVFFLPYELLLMRS